VRTGFSGTSYADNWALLDFDRSEFYTVYIRGDNGRVGFSTVGGTVDDLQGATAVNDGQWHHVAAVYDGTNKYLYVDGVLEATKPNAHGGSALGKSESVRYGMIGDGSEATTYNGNRNHFYYEGDIAEVRIWHATRSASEIQAHIGPGGLAGTEAGLVAYYTFEDGTAKDHTGNGHDGVLFGPAFQSEEPVPAPFASFDPAQGMTLDAGGQVQSWGSVEGNLTLSPSNAATSPTLETEGINGHPALAFDGVDDYLRIPNLEDLNLGGPFDAKTLTLVFQTGSDVTNRQLLYEQGGVTRGLNLFIEAGQLSYSAWNNGEEAWGPLTVTTSVAPLNTYVATLVLDAVAGTLTGYLNNQLVCALDGVKPLYAHSDGGGLGNKNSDTLFPDGSRTTGAFGGKVAFWSTYNTLLATAERDQLEQSLMIKYLDTYLPTLLVAPDDVSLTVINEN
ncbi:MAG: LamG domain-containing protein, partial [Verrucomicrobiota bacterium]